ncbi:MAG: family lipase [Nocardioidaceae bacterium]|nr:family lipase [Nocardioidaceae bacterium]
MVDPMRRQLSILVFSAITALAIAGCSSSDSVPPKVEKTATVASGPSYVAIGDSYTAGPGIAQVDGSSGGCNRSLNNYPHLIAKKVSASSFTDASCAGATTNNVLEDAPIGGRGEPVPAQLNAVKKDTQLVTIGIGGNDDGLFSALASSCTEQGTACADYLKDKLPSVLSTTQTRVAATIDAVKSRAPRAQIILVGYLGVAPSTTGCAALGGAALDTRGVSAGEKSIDTMLQSAATDTGVTYVSMNALSKDHNACTGADAWTNGIVPDGLGVGISLHPRPAGMRAVAAAVESKIATS